MMENLTPNEIPQSVIDVPMEDTGQGTNISLGDPGPVSSLAVFSPSKTRAIEIETFSGPRLSLTVKDVAEWICPGIPDTKAMMLLFICQRMGLDPIAGEIFVSKRVNDQTGVAEWNMFVRQQAWKRLAAQHPMSDGYRVEFTGDTDVPIKPEKLKCKVTVFRKNWREPYVHEVLWTEAAAKIGKGGKPYLPDGGYCRAQPLEFLRGVAVARAVRYVFADRSGIAYAPEEFGDKSPD